MVARKRRFEGGFPSGNDDKVKMVERLIGLEPAYAMTVHKSQGSEFNEVFLVPPVHKLICFRDKSFIRESPAPENRVGILGNKEILKRAIEIQEERPGGVSLDRK